MRYVQMILAATLAAIALVAAAMPTPPAPAAEAGLEPVYVEGGQYTARLHQTSRSWRLLPVDGQDLVITNPDIYCRSEAAAPVGLWVLARDLDGGIELRAPSDTALPTGHDGRIALLPCGVPSRNGAALHAPQALIDWLAANNGAVLIGD
jgi:hypothetical protein